LYKNKQINKNQGVPRDASQAHIKKAFKKLSVKYHPDKNPDGRDQFVELGNGTHPARLVALRCVALRCVALRCVALRCVALRCVALLRPWSD
jgi:hypothetical protein